MELIIFFTHKFLLFATPVPIQNWRIRCGTDVDEHGKCLHYAPFHQLGCDPLRDEQIVEADDVVAADVQADDDGQGAENTPTGLLRGAAI